ncbi:hypothetical protein QYZ87_08845 [Porphyromonadaceae bacterium W3.11]|nr:hypothetical protein [Porphyromonadaceae bacterium W3.11]
MPKSLGEAMHMYTTIFLNSVLVEEAKERLDGFSININNPNTSSAIFLENLKKIINGDKLSDLKLFSWLFTCPLICAFINLNELNMDNSGGSSNNNEDHSELNNYLIKVFDELLSDESQDQMEQLQNIWDYYNDLSVYEDLKQVSIIANPLAANKPPFSSIKVGSIGPKTAILELSS